MLKLVNERREGIEKMDGMQVKMDTIENKMNIALKALKEISKFLNSFSDCELNRSIEVNKKLDAIKDGIEKVQHVNDKLEKMEDILCTDKYIRNYTGQEIYLMHMNKKMSWSKISKVTGLSVSTLRGREKAYKMSLFDDMDLGDEEDVIL